MSLLNADLHCHSTVSDGLLAPAAVVARACANGVDLLALTDHDELGGLAEARAAAAAHGLDFVAGVEISVSVADETVHVVGLGIDEHHPTLVAGLAQVRAGRDVRAEQIGAALAAVGIRGALEGARRYAGNPALVSRAHFARFLVETGVVRDVRTVFSHYLVRGKPGFVEHEWARLEDAVHWILQAGGVAVLAHPGRYRFSSAELEALLLRFKACGGQGLEVVSGAHDGDAVRRFATLARRHGLLASRASDFHGVNESPVDLGRSPPLPPDLIPVWSLLR